MNFHQVEQSVRELKRQVNAGEIDQKMFEARLLELVEVADDGYYWMFGHKSEIWYRHDGQQWVPDNPGEVLAALASNHMSGDKVKTVNHQSISYLHVPEEGPPEIDWASIDWGWFIAGLALLIFIAVAIYLATLGL
jgi:hypothetical protein